MHNNVRSILTKLDSQSNFARDFMYEITNPDNGLNLKANIYHVPGNPADRAFEADFFDGDADRMFARRWYPNLEAARRAAHAFVDAQEAY
jgi:hypothetical protein